MNETVLPDVVVDAIVVGSGAAGFPTARPVPRMS